MTISSSKPTGRIRRFICESSITTIFLLLIFVTLLSHPTPTQARKHHLVLQNDIRRFFPVSTFGYFPGGSLNITVAKFKYLNLRSSKVSQDLVSNQFGFTLAQTISNNYSPFMEGQRACLLNDDISVFDTLGMITFKFDLKNNQVIVNCNSKLSKLTIVPTSLSRTKRAPPPAAAAAVQPVKVPNQDSPKVEPNQRAKVVNVDQIPAEVPLVPGQPQEAKESKPKDVPAKQEQPPAAGPVAANPDQEDSKAFPEEEPAGDLAPEPPKSNSAKKDSPKADPFDEQKGNCYIQKFDMKQSGSDPEYSFQFQMYIAEPQLQGLYALYFHNCLNYPAKLEEAQGYTTIDLDMYIEERNLQNYLSAGEIPLPQLFFALSVIFFILGTIWFYSLQNRASETFKIHYLMGVLVFVKAISLLFHGINYYFIARDGTQVETWAVLYYITHFLKGALMFITIVLIGTGWAFIKHILSDKDKKIFMIVIPLQVIANIADIITEESEEGALIHTVWREIFILVDMICCGAILFPVIWSIRHLQEASATDGKAAINLKKLQLFRHFYVMVVVYIYFTRIIVYLVKITVPFNYEWLDQLFQHVATLIFFILTGYRFQPASSNPYYQLLQEEIEMDEEVLFIQPSTFTEAKKRNRDLESSDVQSLIGRGGAANTYDYD